MKNTHIEHPEDTILTGDLSVLDWFCSMKGAKASLKMDGAPAIVWGTNPTTGNFFVGTKSVFNKIKIKINETHEDIERIIHKRVYQKFSTLALTVYHEQKRFIKVILLVMVEIIHFNLIH